MCRQAPESGTLASESREAALNGVGNGTRMTIGAFAIALVLAALVLAALGTGERGVSDALRMTARWSFLPFWLSYAARPLAGLFGRGFLPLARRAREFGLAYAAAHLIHVGLIAWLYAISTRAPVSPASALFFGTALFWTYLLALLSAERVSRWIEPGILRLLRQFGAQFIMFAFFVDFARAPFRRDLDVQIFYTPFLLLALAGFALWIANAVHQALTHSTKAVLTDENETARP